MDERAALDLVGDLVAPAGDDAAYVDGSVLTIDMLHAATDFPEGTTRYTAGWRTVGASLSDVAAMGAEAVATVAVYGAPAFETGELEDFIAGAQDVSAAVDAAYVGGDLDEHAEFTVATTALGHAERKIGRGGATPGDVVCVTGSLGRSAAAVEAFKAGDEERGNALFRFHPRVEAGLTLADHASAMMDSSDGLARSLHQLGAASDVGFAVESDAIPIADALFDVPAGQGRDAHGTDRAAVLERAITFGEDFELVCTLDPEAVASARSELDVPLAVIGEVTDAEAGVRMDGDPLADAGFTHGT